jgi:hypothetical protein
MLLNKTDHLRINQWEYQEKQNSSNKASLIIIRF